MEAKTNYTIVGAIVLILIGGLLSAGLWLSVGFNQKEYSFYTVYLSESVAGLSEQSPVKYNGVQVGFVKKIELNTNDPRQVELTLSVEKSIPITTSTTATLISQGITGVTYVGLSAGSSDLTPIQRMDGEPYPVIPAKPSLFNQLDMIIKEVSENVNKVSMQTQKIFNEKNARYIQKTLANIEQVTEVIANNSAGINSSIRNLDIFLLNTAKVSKDFPEILKELRVGVKKFNTLAKDMSSASKSVSSTMTSGRNTIDQISQQAVPSATTLLNRLNAISANLEKVSNEMRQNPSVVIRGAKPPQPGPGE
ncbi:MlaD family protein [Legionella sp. km772]|uniref:MlaD family protein n=1 Tax=Legionella sp. km772 TaxID=2498111 RepID=UPI000F8E4F14|nr:MlaD family protein [Legionella sp. km772]RUR10569.1 MCE family protein [Legionella sp. km772]